MCVTESAQGARKLIVGDVLALGGKSKNVKMVPVTLTLTKKMRPTLRDHEIAAFCLAPPFGGLLVYNLNLINLKKTLNLNWSYYVAILLVSWPTMRESMNQMTAPVWSWNRSRGTTSRVRFIIIMHHRTIIYVSTGVYAYSNSLNWAAWLVGSSLLLKFRPNGGMWNKHLHPHLLVTQTLRMPATHNIMFDVCKFFSVHRRPMPQNIWVFLFERDIQYTYVLQRDLHLRTLTVFCEEIYKWQHGGVIRNIF